MKKKKVKLVVEGKKIVINFEDLDIHDVDDSMRKIGSRIAYWGKVLSQAEREKSLAESYYRAWRAEAGKEILSNEKGLAEWKVNQRINSDPTFLKLKKDLASAEFNVSVLCRFYEALKAQAPLLPSKGARERDQHLYQGMTTKKKK